MAQQPDGWATHLQKSCDYRNDLAGSTLATFTGEFSLSVVDCRSVRLCYLKLCDQIGRFNNKISNKNIPKEWYLFGLFCKTSFFVKAVGHFFGNIWAIFFLQYLVTLAPTQAYFIT